MKMIKRKDRWYEATKRDSEREFEARAVWRAAEAVVDCVMDILSAAVAVAGMIVAAVAISAELCE